MYKPYHISKIPILTPVYRLFWYRLITFYPSILPIRSDKPARSKVKNLACSPRTTCHEAKKRKTRRTLGRSEVRSGKRPSKFGASFFFVSPPQLSDKEQANRGHHRTRRRWRYHPRGARVSTREESSGFSKADQHCPRRHLPRSRQYSTR